MAEWAFLVRRVIAEETDDASVEAFRVEVDEGYEPVAVRREDPSASGLPDGGRYDVFFARRL